MEYLVGISTNIVVEGLYLAASLRLAVGRGRVASRGCRWG